MNKKIAKELFTKQFSRSDFLDEDGRLDRFLRNDMWCLFCDDLAQKDEITPGQYERWIWTNPWDDLFRLRGLT